MKGLVRFRAILCQLGEENVQNTTRGIAFAGVSIISFFGSGRALAGPQNIIDLGTLGGITSTAYGVNSNATKVVGVSDNGAEQQAFLYTMNNTYSGGVMAALSDLAGGNASEAHAINLSGQIAGFSRNSNTSSSERAVIWNGTTPTMLTNVAGGTTARAYGLSNNGTAVGFVTVAGFRQAFTYSAGTMNVLALDPSQFNINGSEALSISGDGRYIVGKANSVTALGEVHGFLYDTTNNATYDIVSSANTVAWGVSNSYSCGQESGGGLGWRYNNFTAVSSGAVTPHGGAGVAYDVNNVGEFVGAELDNSGNAIGAWLSDGTNTFDLNDRISNPGVTMLSANAVAEYDQMVAGTASFSGANRAFALVPEPSSCIGFALGLPALGLARRRHKAKKSRK